MIDRIAQILEDLFDIPKCRVEAEDDLRIDWGIDDRERRAFDAEFGAEFGVSVTGTERTVEDYARLVG